MASRVGGITEKHGHTSATATSSAGGSAMDLSNVEEREHDAPVSRAEFTELLHAMREQRRGGGGSSAGASSSGGNYRPRGLPVIPHLTPAQVKEHMESGKCFGCSSTGHRSRECPQKKKDGKSTF